MTGSRLVSVAVVLAVGVLLPAIVAAEVTRVEISSRRDVAGGRAFGTSGPYELIVGRVYFVVDPAHARNKIVTDLDKAPKNAAGQVEFSADLAILKPKDPSHGSGVALVDIVNRGNKTVLTGFNRATPTRDLSTDAELGDGFLLRQGHTLVWVGWEFDVPRSGGMRIEVPVAKGVAGTVHAFFTPESHDEGIAVRDLSGYVPTNPEAAE